MRILFLLLVALFISPTFAQTNSFVCEVEKDKEITGLVLDHCNVGDILLIEYHKSYARNFLFIASQYCDYEKEISFVQHQFFTCVLKTKTPRKIKFIK